MLGGMFPDRYSPEAITEIICAVLVDQEAEHQKKWEELAAWCWAHEVYLAMPIHKKMYIQIMIDEPLMYHLTRGITL